MSAQLSNQQKAFLNDARDCIMATFSSVAEWLPEVSDRRRLSDLRDHLEPGKMLRTRLGLALWSGNDSSRERIVRACAATELIHTATLFHDDVIDGASMRRQQQTLWQQVGETGAILMGDLFFSSALELLLATDDLPLVRSFVAKVKEVCGVEMIHEIIYSGRRVDTATGVRIARGKTGPLFAFVAEACAESAAAAPVYAEAGYKVGTAYQLADDLLDEVGDERVIGKTLGTDRKRSKFTLAQGPAAAPAEQRICEQLERQCSEAIELLTPWRRARLGLENYVGEVLSPIWAAHLEHAG